jgi:transketolase
VTDDRMSELQAMAVKVREHIIRMSTDGGCFIGASLSCADLLVFLYEEVLDIEGPDDPDRDLLFLSKGHDVPALYGTFVELGWMDEGRLAAHLDPADHIYWHPNRAVPGVEFHSGSLGHLLPVAVGAALDAKLRGETRRVVVITGDGELDEGTNWEALLVASAHRLDNLVVVVDRNAFQANMRTEDLVPLEPLEDKFAAFGATARRVDGHDFAALADVFGALPYQDDGPSVVIADTVRGKGLPSIAERADRWFVNFTHEEVDALLAELHGEGPADLTSDTLVVR